MADTGPPWNLRFPGPQDFVRETNFYIEDLAEDVADGLSAAGGLVAVKHVLKTNTFTASAVASGGNVAVTDLEIVHEVADSANRLIISAYFGTAGNSFGVGNTGIAVAQDGTLIGVGAADGSRTPVGAGGRPSNVVVDSIVVMPSITFVHTPGAGLKTYTVRAVNLENNARDVFINRSAGDTNAAFSPRAASALIIQEVKV